MQVVRISQHLLTTVYGCVQLIELLQLVESEEKEMLVQIEKEDICEQLGCELRTYNEKIDHLRFLFEEYRPACW